MTVSTILKQLPLSGYFYYYQVTLNRIQVQLIYVSTVYIRDHLCDFECLSFTETHLDNNIENAELFLTPDFAIPYRKDRTNHGGGILVYISETLPGGGVPVPLFP